MSDFEVLYRTKAGSIALLIDGAKHDPFDVMARTLASMFPGADPDKPDPRFDAIMLARDPNHKPATPKRPEKKLAPIADPNQLF